LHKRGFRRSERFSVLADDTDFFSVDARKLDGFPEKRIFWLVHRKRFIASHLGPVKMRQPKLFSRNLAVVPAG
jgi:hypothetical protein